MPGRNLRSTRKGNSKDYSKLHEGSPLPDEDDEIPAMPVVKKMTKKQKRAAAAAKKQQLQQQEQQNNNDSAPSLPSKSPTTVNDTCSSHGSSSDVGKISDDSAPSCKPKQNNNKHVSSSDNNEDSDEGDAIKKAKEKLRKLRKKEERIRREEKLRQIEEETKQLEKSLKKKQRPKQSKRHQTTNADLRSMSEVVSKVDSLMSDKKLNFKDTSDSEVYVSDPSCISEQHNSDSSAGETEKRRSGRNNDREEEKGRGKKSGKELKLTSNIRYPQKWPHSFLKLHYVAKEKKYDDLTLAEFCAGYIAIMKICKPSHKKARMDHFEELMYHATTKPWKSVLNYHAACLLEIERGDLRWGSNFQLHGLHNTILTNTGSNSNPRGSNTSGANAKQLPYSTSASGSDERVIFCKSFQRGSCNYTRDHYGQFMGENQLLRHICAKCWLAGKKQSPHPEQSDACPLSKVDF